MGEYADAIIDRMIESWSRLPRLRRRGPRKITCRYCGEPDLRWRNVAGGNWRLAKPDGTLHVCLPVVPEDLP